MNGPLRRPAIFTDYPRIAVHAHVLLGSCIVDFYAPVCRVVVKWTDRTIRNLLGRAPMLGAIAGSPQRATLWSEVPAELVLADGEAAVAVVGRALHV